MKRKLQLLGRYLIILLIFCGWTTTLQAQYIAESFEGPVFPPQGWGLFSPVFPNTFNLTGQTWMLDDNEAHSSHGEHSAKIPFTRSSAWLISPGVALQQGEVIQVQYDYKPVFIYEQDATPIDIPLQIGVGTQADVAGQTTVLQTINTTTIANNDIAGYITSSATFTAPTSGVFYFSFSQTYQYSTAGTFVGFYDSDRYKLFLDRIIIQPFGTCTTPDNLTVNNITATSAELDWTFDTSVSNWQVQLIQSHFQNQLPKEENWDNANATPHTSSNLIPGTDYTAYVRSVCPSGGYSSFSEPVSFTTTCPGTIEAPYTIPFISSHTPGCWTESGDNNWQYNVLADYAAEQAGDHTLLQGFTNYAWVDASDNTNGETAVLTSPKIDISSLQNPALEFFVYSENDNNDVFNEFKVELFDGTTWQTAATLATASDGWKFYSIDLNNYGTTPQARFSITGSTASADSFHNDILIDDITFREKTTCLPIENISVTSITDEEATLTWDTGSASSWDIAYGPYNFLFEGIADVTGINTPYTIQSLNPDTMYQFYLRATCSAGEQSSWQGPYSFTTNCPVYIPDFEENFEVNTDPPYSLSNYGFAKCWEIASGGDSDTGPQTLNSGHWMANRDAEYGFYTNSQTASVPMFGANYNSWLLSPLFDLSGANYEVKIRIALTSSGNGEPTIVSMGNDDQIQLLYTEDGTTWQLLKTWSAQDGLTSGTYTNIISLAGITGTNVRFAFWASNGSIDDHVFYSFHVDNLEIRTASNCLEALNLSVDGVTDTTAKLFWGNPGAATSWKVAVVPTGTPASGWITTANNPFEVTGLSPETTYDFYVQSVCGGAESAIETGPFPFTTRCLPVTAPYVESFASQGAPPDCWRANPEALDLSLFVVFYWNFNTNAGFEAADVADHTASGDTYYAWLDGSGINNQERAILTSRLVDISALAQPALQFYIFSKNTIDAAVNKVLVEIYDGDQWQEVTTINQTTNSWAPFTIDLSAYNITGPMEARFTILAQANGGNLSYNDILIDDVGFVEMPNCPAPYNLSVNNLTETSTEINWEYSGSNTTWEVEYGPEGFQPGTGIIVVDNDGSPGIVLTGLDTGVAYDVYITSTCGSEDSEQVGPQTFVPQTLGTSEQERVSISIFPNPVAEILFMEARIAIDQITIYDISGKKVAHKRIHDKKGRVDVSGLMPGIYLMKVGQENTQRAQIFKIIKK